ncbi:MAG: hypothetical protein QXP36_05205 [Conexivisphaerales archaeon]
MRKGCLFQLFLFLIVIVKLYPASANISESPSYSFVYSYGNAKIWVFIEANRTLTAGPSTNCTIFLTVYLEKLGNNKGVFLNRITFKFEDTQLERILSPNVTLQDNMRSWSGNVTFEQDEISLIIRPGEVLSGRMNFELRYDVIDSFEETWPFRVNEEFPISFKNVAQIEQPWITYEVVFIATLLIGVISSIILLWLKIHRYKKPHQ